MANEKTENIESLFSGTHRMNLRICGPVKEILSALRAVNGVTYAEVLNYSEGGDSTSFLVESAKGLDVRKTIFNAMASKGWAIIGFETMGADLEDIFVAVVDEPAADEKKNKRKSGKGA